jgi:transcriptional regulator PpsR
MVALNIAQPDVTLHLDLEGVIRDVQLSEAFAEEPINAWIGRPWIDTIGEFGSDKVERLLEHARASGVSAFRQITQRFPSGLELPMEYTTVRLGGQAGLIAIGKNLQAVAELQTRLIAAQQAMERDYWKLRDVETRCRLLFDASNEAVLVLRAGDLRIVEANPAAIRALGLAPAGREFLPEVAPREREPFQAMLLRVREQGKAPGIMIHLGSERAPWLVRASLMTSEPGSVFLLQLAPVGATPPAAAPSDAPAFEELIERVPDAFVVLDGDGVILHANQSFLNLAQLGAKASVVGESLRRWLGRPGADLKVLLANIQRHGSVRRFSTTLQGELDSEVDVEISGAGGASGESGHIALLLRDVGQRPPLTGDGNRLAPVLGALGDRLGRTPLQKLVKDTVGVVERHYIEAALELTGENRTAAAELLGLSRQSLYAKLNRYGMDGNAHNGSRPD